MQFISSCFEMRDKLLESKSLPARVSNNFVSLSTPESSLILEGHFTVDQAGADIFLAIAD